MNKDFKPYYAVIFTSIKTDNDKGYKQMSELMETLAKKQKGYLGFETARSEIGISVSYWDSLEAIKKWKAHAKHIIAQEKGKNDWYSWYKVRICKVENEYGFSNQLK